MLFLKLAWRNLFRNKRRTFIAGSAIALGLAALIFGDAFFIAEEQIMVDSATSAFLGQAQISREGYREKQAAHLTIENFDRVIEQLESDTIVEAYTSRVQAFGTVSSAADVRGVSIIGIQSSSEPAMSVVDEAIIQGEYLSGNDPHEILIGIKLAEYLEVEMGDRLVVSVAQANTGDISQQLFRISGIYDFRDRSMNSGAIFINIDEARKMLGIGQTAHTIAVEFTESEISRDTTLVFWNNYSNGANEAVSWADIMPQIAMISDMMVIGKVVLFIVLMGIVVFVILNTLFMALYERMFEIGVLRAVGTSPGEVGRLLLFEAGGLAIVGIVIGAVLGLAVTSLVAKYGIDFTGIEFNGITMRDKIYPVLKLSQFIIYPVAVFLFTVIVGIYPAIHAAKIRPAEAMKRSF